MSRPRPDPIPLPRPVAARLEAAFEAMLQPPGAPRIDFTQPPGEPAFASPESLSWTVFANPVSVFVGGVTAVILELAEPRVRTGVWEHSSFRRDPVGRLRRTGLAAMLTVYGPRSAAEEMIAAVARRHARVRGVTPCGQPYAADDPDLLVWVKATAAYGFLEAYARFVRPLSPEERDAFHAEGATVSRLYGAAQAPESEAELHRLFARMAPRLEPSPIVHEFLEIMRQAPLLPAPLRGAQRLLIRAAVEAAPPWARRTLNLSGAGLRPGEGALVRLLCASAERLELAAHPAQQARRRLGLDAGVSSRLG